jgi:hypothetical protein
MGWDLNLGYSTEKPMLYPFGYVIRSRSTNYSEGGTVDDFFNVHFWREKI